MAEVINLEDKFSLFVDHWNPRIVAELNGQQVKLAKLKGEFVWHKHDHEDELFLVHKGILKIEFRDSIVTLNPGEMIVVPKGVAHKPVADEEVEVLLFEPAGTLNTGDAKSELSRSQIDYV